MKWPKIIIIGAIVVLLSSGISMAGYGYLYSPAFRIGLPHNISFSFGDNYKLNKELIIKKETLTPESVKIEEIARLQRLVNKCI